MYTYAIVSCIFFVCILISDFNKSRELYFIGFLLLFIFSAIRLGFGNDYYAYEHIYNVINTDENNPLGIEFGWVIFNSIFSVLNFELLVFTLSGIYIYSIAIFLYRLVGFGGRWLGALIFVINPDLLLVNLSAMRQSMAISIFLLAIVYFGYFRKSTVLTTFLGSFFHISSALITLPIVFSQFISRHRLYFIFFPILYIVLLFFPIKELVAYLSSIFSFFEKYNFYDSGGAISSGLGIIYNLVLSLLLVLVVREAPRNQCFVISCCQFKLLFAAMVGTLSIISRFSLYFEPFFMLLLPALAIKKRNQFLNFTIIGMVIIFNVYKLNLFFTDADNYEHYSIYLTIFHD